MFEFDNINRQLVQKKANTSNVRRAKIVAIAFRKSGSIITSAVNQVTRGYSYKFTNHAEESLLKKLFKLKAKERFGNIIVLTMRWTKSKEWSNAKPCISCYNKLIKYGITEIYYTNEIGKICLIDD